MKKLILVLGLPDGAQLNTRFGISDERATVIDAHLDTVLQKAYTSQTPVLMADVIADGVSIAENDNELAYMAFGVGFNAGAQQAQDPLAGLMQMFSDGEAEDEVNANDLEVEG